MTIRAVNETREARTLEVEPSVTKQGQALLPRVLPWRMNALRDAASIRCELLLYIILSYGVRRRGLDCGEVWRYGHPMTCDKAGRLLPCLAKRTSLESRSHRIQHCLWLKGDIFWICFSFLTSSLRSNFTLYEPIPYYSRISWRARP